MLAKIQNGRIQNGRRDCKVWWGYEGVGPYGPQLVNSFAYKDPLGSKTYRKWQKQEIGINREQGYGPPSHLWYRVALQGSFLN